MLGIRRHPALVPETTSPADGQTFAAKGLAVDRELVRRIVLSSPFAKSPRLSHFLRYICTEVEEGRQNTINEQRIGNAVFGRTADYDSNVDSIVRSHASRLRHRLREYFEQDGLGEPVLLTVPKGSYVPRFEARVMDAPDRSTMRPEVATPRVERVSATHGIVADSPRPSEAVASTGSAVRAWQIAFGIAVVLALACGITLAAHLVGPQHQKRHMFWSTFLDRRHGHTMLVEADSGLVMLQHFTHRPVTLASYMSGEYMRDVTAPGENSETVARLGSRRYTPAVDSAVYERVSRLLPDAQDSLDVRYARDLRLDDLKRGNAILLGTHESDPWVELFEGSMNFTFHNDLTAGTTSMVNRHPLPGEQQVYPMLSTDPEHTVYGLVAYRSNLTHTGHVLIVEGETMAGTQTASEFLLDDTHLLPFLKSIQKEDGTIPHFEVLIRSSSLGGESSKIERIAYRADAD